MNKTIIYLHGFGSSGQSGTVKHLRKIFPQFNVLAPDIPVEPSKAIPFLKQYREDNLVISIKRNQLLAFFNIFASINVIQRYDRSY